jgi:hypothetical protein
VRSTEYSSVSSPWRYRRRIPAVSTKVHGRPSISTMVSTASRVVWATGSTIERSSPSNG